MEFLRFGGELLARDVDSEIVYAEAMCREQRSDEDLANLMDVSLSRAQDDYAGHGTFRAQSFQLGFKYGHGGAHGLRGGHHVGEIHLAFGELLAHVMHAGDVSLVDGVDGGDAGGNS